MELDSLIKPNKFGYLHYYFFDIFPGTTEKQEIASISSTFSTREGA